MEREKFGLTPRFLVWVRGGCIYGDEDFNGLIMSFRYHETSNRKSLISLEMSKIV